MTLFNYYLFEREAPVVRVHTSKSKASIGNE